jgi:hypothetical protein
MTDRVIKSRLIDSKSKQVTSSDGESISAVTSSAGESISAKYPTIPIFNPEELVGRTFLLDKQPWTMS